MRGFGSATAWRRLALAAGATIAVACGKSDSNGNNEGATTTPAPPGPATTGATGAASGAAITGKTVDVKMVLDGSTYKFDPANVTIRPGDGVRWTMVSGGPHNVSFWNDSIPSGAASVLQANMSNQMTPLVGPLLTNPNETYTVSFAGAQPGTYKYYCTPHLAMGMKAQVTVQ